MLLIFLGIIDYNVTYPVNKITTNQVEEKQNSGLNKFGSGDFSQLWMDTIFLV